MRQHFFSHQIEARRIISGRTQPDIIEPQTRQASDSLNNIRRCARDRKAVEQIFGQSELIDEPSVFAGFVAVLRVVVFLMKPPDAFLETVGNMFSRKPGAKRMVSRRCDAGPYVFQRFLPVLTNAQPRRPPNFQLGRIPARGLRAFVKLLQGSLDDFGCYTGADENLITDLAGIRALAIPSNFICVAEPHGGLRGEINLPRVNRIASTRVPIEAGRERRRGRVDGLIVNRCIRHCRPFREVKRRIGERIRERNGQDRFNKDECIARPAVIVRGHVARGILGIHRIVIGGIRQDGTDDKAV